MSPTNRLQLSCAALSMDVRSFRAYDALQQPFVVTLDGITPDPELDLDAVVGSDATFTVDVEAGHRLAWSGLVRRCELLGGERPARLWVELVPRLWLLGQRTNYRIFQDMSELDVVLKLLDEWRIEPIVRLDKKRYRRREILVQYGESDYALLSRMLERIGVAFWVRDMGGSSRMVLSDQPHTAPARAIGFRPEVGERFDTPVVTDVRIDRVIRPGRYVVRDKDFRRPPDVALDGAAGDVPDATELERRLERFHYVPGVMSFDNDGGDTPAADDRIAVRTDLDEGSSWATMRLDAKRGEARLVAFETNAFDLAIGDTLQISDHSSSMLAQPLLVTGTTLGGWFDGRWTLSASAKSAAIPHRPSLSTAAPRVRGVETATVVGPPGDEIHTDEFGRVRVQFHWDREGERNERSSCWLHASQPWAGTGFGGINLPRGGQEVLVEFMGGDADRPIIVGRVYTRLQPVPYLLPADKTKSGWKSSSTEGTGGFNEIMFDDADGAELVRMHAERDLDTRVRRNETRTVRGDRKTRVGNNDSRAVSRHQAQVVEGSGVKTVGGNSDTLTKGAVTRFVGQNERSTVGANRNGFFGGGRETETDGTRSAFAGQRRLINAASHRYQAGGRAVARVEPGTQKWSVMVTSLLQLSGNDVTFFSKDVFVNVNTFTAHAPLIRVGGASGDVSFRGGPIDVRAPLISLNGPGLPAARVNEPSPDKVKNGAATVQVGGPSLPGGATIDADGNVTIGKNLTVVGNREHRARTLADIGRMLQTEKGRALLKRVQRGDGNITISDGGFEDSKVTPGWWQWAFGGRGDVELSHNRYEGGKDIPSDGILYGNLEQADEMRRGSTTPSRAREREKEYLRERGAPKYRTEDGGTDWIEP